MKLLCVTGDFLPKIGGMQLSTHQTLLALFDQGVKLTLVADVAAGDLEFDKLIPYKIFRKGSGSYFGSLKQMLFVSHLYRSGEYDYVMLMGHFPEIAYGFWRKFIPFSPIILAGGTRLHYPNASLIRTFRNFLLRRAYSNSKKIIAISEVTKNSILTNCDPLPPIKCISRPIDELIWQRERELNSQFTIVTIARLTNTKNIKEILIILKELNDCGASNWTYWLFGEGEDAAELEQLASELGISGQIKFWGVLPPEELVELVKRAHVHILLSKSETFGRSYIESAALGIPSIGYETDGTVESIKHGVSGYLVKQGDRAEAFLKLHGLYYNEDLRAELSLGALRFYRENFSKSKIGQELVEYIWR